MNLLPDIREYLALERTLLAYVRTGLSMMGFGFVVARFSLFLRELAAVRFDTAVTTHGPSLWFGTVLVISGVLVNLAAAFEYRRLVGKLNAQKSADWPVSRLPIAMAVLLSVLGFAMALYLIGLT